MDISLEKGVFILSIDTELAWGSVHKGNYAEREILFKNTRPCISMLIKLLEKYQIHATWAIIGHLFLEKCQPVNGIKHPEIIRPKYSWYTNDWFDPDPCSGIEEAPFWYGRDIVEQIRNCPVSQEIGCHTFSHVRIGEPGCSRECFASELRACRVEAEKLGLNLRSFVFPRNSIGYLDVLSEAGFLTYRGIPSIWYERLPGLLSRIGRRLNYYLPFTPPVATPRRENGLLNLPASYFFSVSYKSLAKMFGQSRVSNAKLGIRRAANKQRIFHMWFHPFNLAADPGRLLGDLETIFIEVCRYREAGRLDNLTMGDLAHSL
jgi:hypothetical protein